MVLDDRLNGQPLCIVRVHHLDPSCGIAVEQHGCREPAKHELVDIAPENEPAADHGHVRVGVRQNAFGLRIGRRREDDAPDTYRVDRRQNASRAMDRAVGNHFGSQQCSTHAGRVANVRIYELDCLGPTHRSIRRHTYDVVAHAGESFGYAAADDSAGARHRDPHCAVLALVIGVAP